MTDFHLDRFLVGLPITLAAVLLALIGTWAVAVRIDRHRIVDVAWGSGFALIALVEFVVTGADSHAIVPGVLTVVWGLRLAGHIALRSRGRGEDRRYRALLEKAPGSRAAFALRKIYLTQAAAMWFVSLPVQAAMNVEELRPIPLIAGIVVWAVGFFFESVGDHQLTRFGRQPDSHDRVLNTGLWKYTRHPNYFGDACVWWGLYLLACQHWIGACTILSAAAMTVTLARGTGKPTLEKDIESRRPDYREYVATTSGFIPLPPKG